MDFILEEVLPWQVGYIKVDYEGFPTTFKTRTFVFIYIKLNLLKDHMETNPCEVSLLEHRRRHELYKYYIPIDEVSPTRATHT